MGADVVVSGAGLSGLAAAAMLAQAGRQVQVIARGHGFTHWAAGGIDVLGRLPAGDEMGAGEPVERPLEALGRLPDGHPYSLVGEGALLAGMAKGDFYILCPDNETTPEMDRKRIRWAADDIVQNRPALSRWRPEFADAFAEHMRS